VGFFEAGGADGGGGGGALTEPEDALRVCAAAAAAATGWGTMRGCAAAGLGMDWGRGCAAGGGFRAAADSFDGPPPGPPGRSSLPVVTGRAATCLGRGVGLDTELAGSPALVWIVLLL
jgi:hypothetical protein